MLTAVLPQFVASKEINTPEPEEKSHQLSEAISYHAITHGGIQLAPDPDLGVAVYGQTEYPLFAIRETGRTQLPGT